jgi:hypothetical protein
MVICQRIKKIICRNRMVAIACQGSGSMGTNDKPHLPARLSTGAGAIDEIEMDRVADYVSNVDKPATKGG